MQVDSVNFHVISCDLGHKFRQGRYIYGMFLTVMYRSIRNFNIPPGQPRAFDETLCPGAGNSTLGSARGLEFEPKGGEGPGI